MADQPEHFDLISGKPLEPWAQEMMDRPTPEASPPPECNCARRYDPDQIDHEGACEFVASPSVTTEPVRETLIKAGLHARVPGGAEVWAWLPQADAWTPHETARDVMGAAVDAILRAMPAERIREALTRIIGQVQDAQAEPSHGVFSRLGMIDSIAHAALSEHSA